MREYGKVYPRFWTAGTGKTLRGDMEAQVLCLYLMTCPHANMIGVFHCPIMYMAHETGMTIEGASKALERLIEAGFCTFDGVDDVVFVHEMAAHQIGVISSPKDKQVIGLKKHVAQIAQPSIRAAFIARYKVDFYFVVDEENTSPLQGPSKPLRSQEQEQEQEITPRETIVSLVANDVGNKVDKVPDCPQQQIVELFGELLPELPQPRAWEGQRANNLKARWRWVLTAKRTKNGERYATDAQTGIEFFRRMFGYVRESDFLMGRGKAGWLGCDLGWLVKAENFEKVLAGNYENREAAA